MFEGMVKLLNDDSILEYLADITWEYYRQTTTEVHCDLDRINHQIEALERAKGNLLDAIQSGLPYSAVKDRMEQLSLESDSLKEKKASFWWILACSSVIPAVKHPGSGRSRS